MQSSILSQSVTIFYDESGKKQVAVFWANPHEIIEDTLCTNASHILLNVPDMNEAAIASNFDVAIRSPHICILTGFSQANSELQQFIHRKLSELPQTESAFIITSEAPTPYLIPDG